MPGKNQFVSAAQFCSACNLSLLARERLLLSGTNDNNDENIKISLQQVFEII